MTASNDGGKQPLSSHLGVSRLTLLCAVLGLAVCLFLLVAIGMIVPGPFEVCHGRPPGHCHDTWFGEVSHVH